MRLCLLTAGNRPKRGRLSWRPPPGPARPGHGLPGSQLHQFQLPPGDLGFGIGWPSFFWPWPRRAVAVSWLAGWRRPQIRIRSGLGAWLGWNWRSTKISSPTSRRSLRRSDPLRLNCVIGSSSRRITTSRFPPRTGLSTGAPISLSTFTPACPANQTPGRRCHAAPWCYCTATDSPNLP